MTTTTTNVIVVVPDGLGPGDDFIIGVEGKEFNVSCPEDAYGGMEIELMLPSGEGDGVEHHDDSIAATLVVVVPEECSPGDYFVVTTTGPSGEDITFETIVPNACYGGQEVEVRVPLAELQDPLQAAAPLGKREYRRRSTEEVEEAEEDLEALLRTRVGAFTTFSRLMVERNDGSWTKGAHVEGYDYYGDTYTVRLPDGQLKYLVERVSLREERVGTFARGQAVRVVVRGASCYCTVEDYDDEHDFYNLRVTKTGTWRMATGDEIETVSLDAL